MKEKIKRTILMGIVIACFSSTAVMAASYNFSLMTGSVGYTGFVTKSNSLATASVKCNTLNYPSATMKYRVRNSSYTQIGSSTKQGTGSVSVTYTKTVAKGATVSLGVENLSSNGGVTITTTGTWTP